MSIRLGVVGLVVIFGMMGSVCIGQDGLSLESAIGRLDDAIAH